MCQYYFQLEPKKIRDLRPDTLAQMMALGNVRPGARVVVVDDVSGLLTAAVVERLGGAHFIIRFSFKYSFADQDSFVKG